MKKIWTLLVAAITVLAVLTSGCGSSYLQTESGGMMKISEAFSSFGISFEIFPPKTEQGLASLYEELKHLSAYKPEFISVTYGAGGSTRDKTIDLSLEIRKRFGIDPLVHFTCVGAGRDEIRAYLEKVKALGLTNILALRGDPPAGAADFEALAADTPAHRRALAQLGVARAGLNSAKSQYVPELSANASAGRSGEDWMPDQDEWFVGLSLSFPFFQGGKNVMNVRGAEAEFQRVEANLRATDAGLVLALQQALADYADAVDRTEVQAAYLKAEEVRAEIGRSQYASGMLSFEDWDRIENDLIGSQKDDLAGRRDAVTAEANWEKVQGKSVLPE